MPTNRSKRSSKKPFSRSGDRDPFIQDTPPSRSSSRISPLNRNSSRGSVSKGNFEPLSDRGASQPIRPRRAAPRAKVSPERFSILGRISPERKMDIFGLGMAIIGLLMLLSLFSTTKGGFTSLVIQPLTQAFGWGVYILPVGLVVVGAWLVARNLDRLPKLNIERIVGMLLLFVGLLVTFHGIDGTAATAFQRARAGHGGGYLGALLQQGLVGAIDVPGTIIVVVAWLVIAVAMTLDLSMQEMFKWAGPLGARLK